MNEYEIDIDAILAAGRAFGEAINKLAGSLHKAAASLGEAFSKILPVTDDPHGWHKTWERQIKKLERRERYLRRYRQRGLRMKRGGRKS